MPLALLALCAGALLAVRRCGAGVLRGARVRRRAGLVAAALLVVAVGCTQSSSSDAPSNAESAAASAAASGPDAALTHAAPTWGDGYDHVVVFAVGAAGSPTGGSFAGESRPLVMGTAPPGTVDTAPDADQATTVFRLDGSTGDVMVPRESLVAVVPATADETAALQQAAAADGVALLVVDVHGVVGAAGARYVMAAGSLVEVPAVPATDSPPLSTGGGADTRTATGAPAPGADPFVAALRDADGVVEATEIAPGVVAVTTSGSRADLAVVDGVSEIADDTLLDFASTPDSMDPRQAEQWMLANTGAAEQAGGWTGVAGADTRAPRAWTVSEGAGVIVAVVDSGVDLTNPELAGRIWINPNDACGNGIDDDANGKTDDCRGWDFGTDDADVNPDPGVTSNDHGTHIAGVIAAGHDDAGVVGIAPSATIMALKVANATGAIPTSAVYGAVVYAVDHGAQVVNISLATRPGTTRASVSALENAVVYARARGVLLVAGTGNDGVDITTKAKSVWPASFSLLFDNVIAAGATTNSDTRASFSNFGDPATLYAPGWWMLSTLPGGTFGYQSGTSQAAAVASGAAADVIASGMATTPSAIRQRLVDTAAVTTAGYRIDVAAAVGIPPDPVITVAYSGVDQLAPNTPSNVDVTVTATKMPAPVAKVRLSLAAAVDYQVFAVEGVTSQIGEQGGATSTVTTDVNGAFPPLAVLDPEALATTGWVLSASIALPKGDYAFVTEMLDANDAPLAGAQVAYVSVGGGLPVATTVVATSVPGSTMVPTTGPTSSSGATTLPGSSLPSTTAGGATTVPGSTTTSDPTTTLPGATTLPSGPSTSAGPSTSGPATSGPATSGPATTAPSTAPSTTAGSSTSAPATTAATTVPVSTTVPTTAPATTAPVTTVSGTTIAPTTTMSGTPATTTPPPSGQSQGIYTITSMSPRYATLDGDTVISITGRFPTTIPVYVWFGDKGIVEATSGNGTSITLTTPVVQTTGITDVSVKFTLDTAYNLTLTNAFTFGTTPAPTTTVRPTTTAGPTTTRPSTTTTVRPSTTTTVRPATTTTARPTTTVRAATTTTLSPTANVRLRTQPASGALAVLSTVAWPRPGCSGASCPATSL